MRLGSSFFVISYSCLLWGYTTVHYMFTGSVLKRQVCKLISTLAKCMKKRLVRRQSRNMGRLSCVKMAM